MLRASPPPVSAAGGGSSSSGRGSGGPSAAAVAWEQHALGVVVGTGMGTSKGELVRRIVFPKEIEFKYTQVRA